MAEPPRAIQDKTTVGHNWLTKRLDDQSVESRTIQVYNTPNDVSGDTLDGLFNHCGRIREIKRQYDKTHRGFCWNIEFDRAEAARTACALDGTKLIDREINIVSLKFNVDAIRAAADEVVKPKPKDEEEGPGGPLLIKGPEVKPKTLDEYVQDKGFNPHFPPEELYSHADSQDKPTLFKSIYIGNLPMSTDQSTVVQLCEKCGPVARVFVGGGGDEMTFKWAIAEFVHPGAALSAKNLSGQVYGDRQIIVERSSNVIKPEVAAVAPYVPPVRSPSPLRIQNRRRRRSSSSDDYRRRKSRKRRRRRSTSTSSSDRPRRKRRRHEYSSDSYHRRRRR
eukprot:NODE_679_length_1269_cov_176.429072_g640_i0.p1 GENE.NODE_679_length_1269_cov_176.429072_g640_i0~~NODE_679_length_1269_cov_176.429072_g640_i0.p1  ORF type:complete len:335 (-),score=26.26 NODE_679_length_1269_cov_176.429072_g640_i0:171-1175(-)